jgi:preprotein translocase subunit SecG
MKNVILIIQSLVSVALIAAIVIQARGSGLGSIMGGTGESYRSRRGFEKILFIATIVLAVAFFLSSIANILV